MRRLAAAALLINGTRAQTSDEAAVRSCSATYRRNACVADVVEVIQLKKHERAGDCCGLCLADARCAAVTSATVFLLCLLTGVADNSTPS